MRPRRIGALALILSALIALWSFLYIHIAFDGRLTIESLGLKALSIPLMVLGALFFALLVSELVERHHKAT